MKKHQWRMALVKAFVCFGMIAGLVGCMGDDDDNDSTGTPGLPSSEGGNVKNLQISDSLKNGTSVATAIGGGEFTSEGYQITADGGYIIYDTQIKGNFRIEFDTKGLTAGEWYHDPDDQATLLFMQDAPLGTDWTQWQVIDHCLFQMIKMAYYPGGESSVDGMKVKGGCGGATGFELWSWMEHGDNGVFVGPAYLEWDSTKTYHWVVTVKNGHTEGYRDGQLLFSGDGFWPGDPMRFMFGGTGMFVGGVSPDNAIYSNIKIYQE